MFVVCVPMLFRYLLMRYLLSIYLSFFLFLGFQTKKKIYFYLFPSSCFVSKYSLKTI